MSVVNLDILKGIDDRSINASLLKFPFTTAQLRIDFLNRYNNYVQAYRVINRDLLAGLTYRQDGSYTELTTIDPASQDSNRGWTSYLEVNPNVVSGSGVLEVDVVTRENAQKKLRPGQIGR